MRKPSVILRDFLNGLRFSEQSKSKCIESRRHRATRLAVEALERRELLSMATLHWVGGASDTWGSDRAWVNQIGDFEPFEDGDTVIFDVPYKNTQVKITGNIQPSEIEFDLGGYTLFTQNGSTISQAPGCDSLKITVAQPTVTADYIATISANIVDRSASDLTLLEVNARKDVGTNEVFLPGQLILNGNNSYRGGTHVTNVSDGTTSYGGTLVAGNVNALPKDESGVYRKITVESLATLAVETGSSSNEWTTGPISALLNNTLATSYPEFKTDSNFGIWVDGGTEFEYAQTIPGNSGGMTNLNENFVKLGVGTLTLSGDNRRDATHYGYPGTTSVNKGTLIEANPNALPRYGDGVKGEVTVRNTTPASLPNVGYGNYPKRETGDDYDGTQDPHSTLVVRADGTTDSWAKAEINRLLYGTTNDAVPEWTENPWSAKFDSNTNFGVEVSAGEEFSLEPAAGYFFSLGNVTVTANVKYNTVGVVKLGGGTLTFGSSGQRFAGPVCIYEGTLKAAAGRNTFAGNSEANIVSGFLGTALYMNSGTTFDLNASDGVVTTNPTSNQISELHGLPGAIITDSGPIYGASISGGLELSRYIHASGVKCVYSGDFIQGARGRYPSLSVATVNYAGDPNVLVLNGSRIDLARYWSAGEAAGNVQDPNNITPHIRGLAGVSAGPIEQCFSTTSGSALVSPSAPSRGRGCTVGGLVGWNWGTGKIYNSFATGDVYGWSYVGGFVGIVGIVGTSTGTGSIIDNCYATGDVDALWRSGGFIAATTCPAQITDCFAAGVATTGYGETGEFIAVILTQPPTFEDCFYSTERGQSNPSLSGITGTDAANYSSTSFAVYQGSTPWDFDDEWVMVDGLPRLRAWVAA